MVDLVSPCWLRLINCGLAVCVCVHYLLYCTFPNEIRRERYHNGPYSLIITSSSSAWTNTSMLYIMSSFVNLSSGKPCFFLQLNNFVNVGLMYRLDDSTGYHYNILDGSTWSILPQTSIMYWTVTGRRAMVMITMWQHLSKYSHV